MLIIPSKELLLISAQQSKEIFLFDPKTSAVITKYHTDPSLGKPIAFYPQANQFLTSFTNKTFLNIWSSDCQQPINKVSTTDLITYLILSNDKNILFGGSQNGNIYIWQLPSGILLKKQTLHSNQIKRIIQFKAGYLMTASKQQIKIWTLGSLLLQTQKSIPIKTINSVLQIIDVQFIRNVFIMLTSKFITYYLAGNQNNAFTQISKQDIQFPTSICTSLSHVYIGDFQGTIHANQIQAHQNNYQQLQFQYEQKNQSIQINKVNKKFTLKSPNKHPITSLVHLKSISYLVCGNTQGDITIWQNNIFKKSVKLFKTSIKFIHSIPRPIQEKIPQNLKINPLAKYQMNKQAQPLTIDLAYLANESLNQKQFNFQQQIQGVAQNAENQLILQRILNILNRPDQMLKNKIQQLEQQKQSLFKANMHYCQILNKQDTSANFN